MESVSGSDEWTMTTEQIENWFTYHAPTPEQQDAYLMIREQARRFAHCLDQYCPESADKSAAMRQLRECVMTANASIACGGK